MTNEFAWSICESCKNFISGCSWSESFIPVKGWTAEKNGNTYIITECPLYEHETDEPTVARDDQCVKDMINAVVERAVKDYIMSLSGRKITAKSVDSMKYEMEVWSRSNYARTLCGDLDVPEAFARIREKYVSFCVIADGHWDDEPNKNGDIYFRCPMCGERAVIKGRKRAMARGLERLSVRTARCSCGCEYRREENVFRKLY